MPVLMACPHTGCNHPGPLGFTDGGPWGRRFYHGNECPGAWLYNDQWYQTEVEAWLQYKKDNPHLSKSWVKAFDARIVRNNERSYKFWINKWNEEQDQFLQSQWRR